MVQGTSKVYFKKSKGKKLRDEKRMMVDQIWLNTEHCEIWDKKKLNKQIFMEDTELTIRIFQINDSKGIKNGLF